MLYFDQGLLHGAQFSGDLCPDCLFSLCLYGVIPVLIASGTGATNKRVTLETPQSVGHGMGHAVLTLLHGLQVVVPISIAHAFVWDTSIGGSRRGGGRRVISGHGRVQQLIRQH